MNTFGKKVKEYTLGAVTLLAISLMAACSTINGLATDLESGGRLVRTATQKSANAQKTTRIRESLAEKKGELERAAELVLRQTN